MVLGGIVVVVLLVIKGWCYDKKKWLCVVGYCGVDSLVGEEKLLVGLW